MKDLIDGLGVKVGPFLPGWKPAILWFTGSIPGFLFAASARVITPFFKLLKVRWANNTVAELQDRRYATSL